MKRKTFSNPTLIEFGWQNSDWRIVESHDCSHMERMEDRVEDEASTKYKLFALNASHHDQNKGTFSLTSVSNALFVGCGHLVTE